MKALLVREVPRRPRTSGTWLVWLLAITFAAIVPIVAAIPRGGLP